MAFMMKRALLLAVAVVALCAAAPAPSPAARAPAEIVEAAPAADWAQIAPSDLLVMDLAPDAKGAARRVVIQLLPAPFSGGWIGNIRKLAAAKWWDGTSINRVQDGYVVQWGDPDGEDKPKAKPLPAAVLKVPESDYSISLEAFLDAVVAKVAAQPNAGSAMVAALDGSAAIGPGPWARPDAYAKKLDFFKGWPLGGNAESVWPIHCYAAVGVGRDYPPDTGSGAELYAVIGQAPRQLDRNIAVVGRVIEGMEHLSSLPRGTGDIGFYKTAEERTPIRQIRIGTDVPDLPRYEYLSTESASFARYADARANRRDRFYIRPAGGVDICNVPVPVRRVK
jgi:peptidylprolyl isomerase